MQRLTSIKFKLKLKEIDSFNFKIALIIRINCIFTV